MEKEVEKKTVVLQEKEEIGFVKISDDVVANIAGIAAKEVEGVSLASAGNELMSKVSKKGTSKGVTAEVINNTVKIEIAIVIDYGYNIPATCTKVQEKAKNAVENMTGLECVDVSIRIAAVKVN